jgi:hypothetical protein
MKYALALIIYLMICGCGSGATKFSETVPTQSIPIIKRVEPTTVTRNATLSLFGFGFSVIPSENIVSLGNTATVATSYALAETGNEGEIEVLQITVPADADLGENLIFMTVDNVASNADQKATVTVP